MESATLNWHQADDDTYTLRWGDEQWVVYNLSDRWLVWHFIPELPDDLELLGYVWASEWNGTPCVSHHITLARAQSAVASQIYERKFDNIIAFDSHPVIRRKKFNR